MEQGSRTRPVEVVVVRSEADLIEAVRAADAGGIPVWIGAPGDAVPPGFEGRVIEVATAGMAVNDDGCEVDSLAYCGGVQVTLAAGEDWPAFVALAVARDWVGVEWLGGYRGTIGGATEVNHAGFGHRMSDVVAAVRTYDRTSGALRRFASVDCLFTDGGSRFSAERLPDGSASYVLLDVAVLLRQGDLTAPVRDPDAARLLGVVPGQRVPLTQALAAVRAAASAPAQGA